MKMRAVMEILAESYAEQQLVLSRFPDASWLSLKENRTMFYIDYAKYTEVREVMDEINLKKIEEKKKGCNLPPFSFL